MQPSVLPAGHVSAGTRAIAATLDAGCTVQPSRGYDLSAALVLTQQLLCLLTALGTAAALGLALCLLPDSA